jgi:cytochrome d ubiquinol oxidase subunit I
METALVEWSRAQFALTAIYHWLFVPLTLGLSFIMAIMETMYYKTGNPQWKRTTKFWMTLFGINFAIGVATGIILEFEFGTNWSNYSWFVGDIFGAPLAIEGIMAFFLESTFIAVMFFGWQKVSKKFHLVSTWLVALGSNLSALWILVANAWMQNPVGMQFNPDTARNEMQNFWDVLLSGTAVDKFLHTLTSGFIISSLFVIGVSAWFMLRNREILFAKRSMIIGAVFGLLSSVFIVITGDSSGNDVAETQPMKLAAMEGLYEGQEGVDLVAIGILNSDKTVKNDEKAFHFKIGIPNMLSLLAERDADAFVPGMRDLVYGNKEYNIPPTSEKIKKGKIALQSLKDYKKARKNNNDSLALANLKTFENHYDQMGYGYFEKEESVVPPVELTFYSFHLMVILGFYFILLFAVVLWLNLKDRILEKRFILKAALWSIPLGYIASQLGWVVSEVGRQPWTIQDVLPTHVSTSHISAANVQTTFWLFTALFTILLIAEISILVRQIKIGPK